MIEVIGHAAPQASKEFLARLRRFDPTLLVVWHQKRRCWMVEQCTRHLAPTAEHSHVCARTHVCMVRDADGFAMPLCDRVFQRLAAMDNWRKGYGPDQLQRFIADSDREAADRKQKEKDAMALVIRENSRDNRRQLLKADRLIQQHDLRPNR